MTYLLEKVILDSGSLSKLISGLEGKNPRSILPARRARFSTTNKASRNGFNGDVETRFFILMEEVTKVSGE